MSGKELLFISHAEKDVQIVELFVDLLYDMGCLKRHCYAAQFQK